MNRAGLDGRRLTDLLASFDWDLAEHEWHGFFDHGCALCLIAGCVDVDVVRSYAIAVDLPPGSPSYKIIEAARVLWDEAMRDSGRAGWLVESTIDMSVR
jgi:hypothetical protein